MERMERKRMERKEEMKERIKSNKSKVPGMIPSLISG